MAIEERELEEQMEAATAALRAAVLRLLREGEVHTEMIVAAVAQVAGEVAATSAIASGRDLEEVLGELFEAVGYAGRRHGETLRVELAGMTPEAPDPPDGGEVVAEAAYGNGSPRPSAG